MIAELTKLNEADLAPRRTQNHRYSASLHTYKRIGVGYIEIPMVLAGFR